MKLPLLALLNAINFGTICATCAGAKLYELTARSAQQVEYLRVLDSTKNSLDFWKLTRWIGEEAHVLVPAEEASQFETDLLNHGIQPILMNSNVTTCDDDDNSSTTRPERYARYSAKQPLDITRRYLSYDDINNYLEYLARKYPEMVTLRTIGHSYEKRPLRTITISTRGGGKSTSSASSTTKTILIDAGIHAREWIAPATALYVMSQLVQRADKNRDLLGNFTWTILPVANPDGYEYSRNTNSFWRKTRQPHKRCIGTDANRNFGYHWGEKGASQQECSQTFAGPGPFSEPETQAIRNLLLANGSTPYFYLTLHSYGRYLLYPWGHRKGLPRRWRLLDAVARAGSMAMRQQHNANYRVGGAANLLYEAAGGSDDYALAVARVPVSITMELPSDENGFHPAEAKIRPFVEEAFTGIRAMALKLVQMRNV